MKRRLHIVSFNVPLPADYGGVIDVFYRLKALSEAGVEICLHCFTYGRPKATELERYCAEVHYYQRDMSPLRQLSSLPFIVSSRHSDTLRQRLLRDRKPILFEGLHCCALLADNEVCRDRIVMVRAHNVESHYYSELADSEHNPLRRLYLKADAAKIRRYEPILARATAVFAISASDKAALEHIGCRNVQLMTGAHPYTQVVAKAGRGDYALYHGNLAVAENYRAVEYISDNIFNGTGTRLVVAGGNPPQWLKNKLAQYPNITLVANPNDEQMSRLLAESQVCLLTTNQPTGLKLKLLNSLFGGRYCLVNSNMVAGSGLESLCEVADGTGAIRERLAQLMATDFSLEQVARRTEMLKPFITSRAIEPLLSLL